MTDDATSAGEEPVELDEDRSSSPEATDAEPPQDLDEPLADGESIAVVDEPDAVARQRDEYLDALVRTQADFENFRKRSLKQQGDAVDRATGRLVEDLLPVLDACDAAAVHGVDEVEAIVSALLAVLERSGLERIEPSGEAFDPNAHDAVLHEPADDPQDEPTVAEVLRPGYSWKGRVIRPAMVKVKG